jgi:hypothetical protein
MLKKFKVDMSFGTWNVRSFYRAGSLKTEASELAKCYLDLVAVQESRLDEVGSQPADGYTFLYGNGSVNHHLGIGFFIHMRIRSAGKTIKFVSDRMLYIILRGRWRECACPK